MSIDPTTCTLTEPYWVRLPDGMECPAQRFADIAHPGKFRWHTTREPRSFGDDQIIVLSRMITEVMVSDDADSTAIITAHRYIELMDAAARADAFKRAAAATESLIERIKSGEIGWDGQEWTIEAGARRAAEIDAVKTAMLTDYAALARDGFAIDAGLAAAAIDALDTFRGDRA